MLLPPVFLPQEPGSLCRELRVGVLLRPLTRTAPGGVSAGPIRCGPRGHLLRTPFVCRISLPRLPSLLQFGFRAPPTHTACLSKGCLLPALGPGAKGCDSPPLPHEGPPGLPRGQPSLSVLQLEARPPACLILLLQTCPRSESLHSSPCPPREVPHPSASLSIHTPWTTPSGES